MAASDESRPPRLPPTFEPQRRASKRWLAVAFVAGPLMWTILLFGLAYFVKHQRAVQIALVVVVVSLLISFAFLIPMRNHRIREEENA